MPANATMLAFYTARGAIFGLTLDQHNLHIQPVSTVGKVREIQEKLQFQLSRFWLGSAHVERFHEDLEQSTKAHLRELYAELVAPLRERLSGNQLIVVPHGSLHTIPFHALLSEGSYLIDDFAVSYAPSASVYQMCGQMTPKQTDGDLLLGVSRQANRDGLDEVEAVKQSLPSLAAFVGKEGTKAKLCDLSSQASRIHICSSGLVRRDNPMFSEIQLADSGLALFDLYELNLSSELVALTGCGSSLTSVDDGDELTSMTRGLLHAGAESVVTTLWDSGTER